MILLATPPDGSEQHPLRHKIWTRDELLLLEPTGIFDDTHFELLEGELIDKRGSTRSHVIAVRSTALALENVLGQEHVLAHAPIDVSPEDNAQNEPEPDVALLRHSFRSFSQNPLPVDIALLVEVGDRLISLDLITKVRLYARAGIFEYWVVDLNNRSLHVFRDPKGDNYETRFELREGDSISPLERPDHSIVVSTLLG